MSEQKFLHILKTSIIAFILMASPFALAEIQCEPLPACVNLGYQLEIECPEGSYIYCPFSLDYKKCLNPSCEALGFSPFDKTSWCQTIVECPTDAAYTLCADPKTD